MIGATGVVGREVVNQLAQADYVERVVTLTRRVASHDSPKVENHMVEFDELEKYSMLFEGDLLFSCLGTTRRVAGSREAQRKVDIDYQFRGAKMAKEGGVNHYLLVSSSGANATSSNGYLQMKGELEQKVISLDFERVSIFRPSLLLGERHEFRFGERLGAIIMPFICQLPGLRRYRPIKGKQVAEKMVRVSGQPGTGVDKYVLDELFLPS